MSHESETNPATSKTLVSVAVHSTKRSATRESDARLSTAAVNLIEANPARDCDSLDCGTSRGRHFAGR